MNKKIIKAMQLLEEAKSLIEEVENEVLKCGVISDDKLSIRIESLNLSTRTKNCLRYSNIENVYELIQLSERELLRFKDLGRFCLQEINSELDKLGLKLDTDISSIKHIKSYLNNEQCTD